MIIPIIRFRSNSHKIIFNNNPKAIFITIPIDNGFIMYTQFLFFLSIWIPDTTSKIPKMNSAIIVEFALLKYINNTDVKLYLRKSV